MPFNRGAGFTHPEVSHWSEVEDQVETWLKEHQAQVAALGAVTPSPYRVIADLDNGRSVDLVLTYRGDQDGVDVWDVSIPDVLAQMITNVRLARVPNVDDHRTRLHIPRVKGGRRMPTAGNERHSYRLEHDLYDEVLCAAEWKGVTVTESILRSHDELVAEWKRNESPRKRAARLKKRKGDHDKQ